MKKPEFKFNGTHLEISVEVDPNGDGQPVASLKLDVDLAEIPDEVMSAIASKKEVK